MALETTPTVTEPEPSALVQGIHGVAEDLAEELQLRRIIAIKQIAQEAVEERNRRRQRSAEARGAGASPDASVVQYSIGNRTYDLDNRKNCNTCSSRYRGKIESLLMQGRTPGWISKNLPEDSDVKYASILNHSKHLTGMAAQTRQIQEERAVEIGRSIEEGNHFLVDEVTLSRIIVMRVSERIGLGEIEPTIGDAMAAAKFLSTTAAAEGGGIGVDQEAYAASTMRYFELAKANMEPQDFLRFMQQLRSDPILAAIEKKKHDPDEASVIDVEAIE
jgi:hypothetical protein